MLTSEKTSAILIYVVKRQHIDMREWRNRQTRSFKVRVGDHTGSSPVSRTIKNKGINVSWYLCFLSLKKTDGT